jgi:hypothetical protein
VIEANLSLKWAAYKTIVKVAWTGTLLEETERGEEEGL